jgi:hypothetical protein
VLPVRAGPGAPQARDAAPNEDGAGGLAVLASSAVQGGVRTLLAEIACAISDCTRGYLAIRREVEQE